MASLARLRFLAVFFCNLAAAGAAATLFVEVTGVDVGVCSAPQPCASISFALSQAVSKDVIELGPGRYAGAGFRNLDPGTAGKGNVTIRGRGGRAAVHVDLGAEGRFIRLSGAAGAMRIEGISISNGSCAALPAGSRYGAGVVLDDSSEAALIDLALTDMDCNSKDIIYGGEYSGGALFLKNSRGVVRNCLIRDNIANHGAGAATWGRDRAAIEDSVFERNEGTKWGGTLLTEEQSRTTFTRVRFSYGICPYGAHLDDGGTAAPAFRHCVFEYGYAAGHG